MFRLINPEQLVAPVSFFDWLSVLVDSKRSQARTHFYTNRLEGTDYVFERIEASDRAVMTAYGRRVRAQDYIILSDGRYQVDTIDYYANPSNLWTAMLIKVLESPSTPTHR